MFLWTWHFGPKGKTVFFHCESWIVPASNLPKKHTGWFFSLLQQLLWSCFFFFFLIFENKQKKQSACHFLLGSHLTVQFHLIREMTGMELKTQRTLSPNCFSHVMVQCVLKVFIHLWNCMETCFCEPGIWCLMAKELFSLVKSHSCRNKLARKTLV